MSVCKKVAYIFLCGLLCAGLLMLEKSYFAEYTVETGAFLAESLISIEKSPIHTRKVPIIYNEYADYILQSDFNIKQIITTLEKTDSFDFNRLVKNWNTLTISDKIRWFKSHTYLYGFDGKTCTIQLYIGKNEVIDADFLVRAGPQLLEALVKNTVATLHLTYPDDTVTVLNNRILYPPPAVFTRKGVIKKYGIIGFGLGMILATMILLWYHVIQGKGNCFAPNEHLLLLKQVFIKKIIVITLWGILCAGLLMFIKVAVTDFSVRKGEGGADYIIVVDERINHNLKKPSSFYTDLLGTYRNFLDDLVTTLRDANSFSIEKAFMNWRIMNQKEREKWLRQHIGIGNCGGSVTRLYFYIKDSEIKDSQYFEQNINRFMEGFLNYTVEKYAYPRPDMIRIVSKSIVVPENFKVDAKSVLPPYGLLGFILGSLCAFVVFAIRAIRMKEHVS